MFARTCISAAFVKQNHSLGLAWAYACWQEHSSYGKVLFLRHFSPVPCWRPIHPLRHRTIPWRDTTGAFGAWKEARCMCDADTFSIGFRFHENTPLPQGINKQRTKSTASVCAICWVKLSILRLRRSAFWPTIYPIRRRTIANVCTCLTGQPHVSILGRRVDKGDSCNFCPATATSSTSIQAGSRCTLDGRCGASAAKWIYFWSYWSDVSRLYFTEKRYLNTIKWWIFTDVLFHKDVPKSILPLSFNSDSRTLSKRNAAGASLHRVSRY